MDLIKLIFVDLDNTFWNGILLEDNFSEISLNIPLVEKLIHLDKSGVLLAVVSRNHADDVEDALNSFGLSSLFVSSEISFKPKSEAIHNLLRFFRFAPSACLFVDDSAFERAEVQHAFPDMKTVSPEEFIDFDDENMWAYASSYDAALTRKKSYVEERQRKNDEASYCGTFRQFLKQSELVLKLSPAFSDSVGRISELAKRTNQINFSANRYSIEEVEQLLKSERFMCYVAEVSDRYGDYGLVGFACIRLEKDSAVVQDLMLSCRVQSKGIESAIIVMLAEKVKSSGLNKMVGLFRPTRRNGQIAGAYQKLGFSPAGTCGEYQKFEIELDCCEFNSPAHISMVYCDASSDGGESGIPFVRNIVQDAVNRKFICGDILDVGAGWDGVLGEDCDEFLEIEGNKHIRLDMEKRARTDIVADATNMAVVGDETVDSVLCLEVLEHCANPFTLSSEILRVLRPGGCAVVSAPMNYVIHDTPGDYWRFTPDGLKMLFADKITVVSEFVEGNSDFPVRTILVFRKKYS